MRLILTKGAGVPPSSEVNLCFCTAAADKLLQGGRVDFRASAPADVSPVASGFLESCSRCCLSLRSEIYSRSPGTRLCTVECVHVRAAGGRLAGGRADPAAGQMGTPSLACVSLCLSLCACGFLLSEVEAFCPPVTPLNTHTRTHIHTFPCERAAFSASPAGACWGGGVMPFTSLIDEQTHGDQPIE